VSVVNNLFSTVTPGGAQGGPEVKVEGGDEVMYSFFTNADHGA
jgi:hypothetical protein